MRTPIYLLLSAFLFAPPVEGQFTKHVDEHGHVTYSDEPGYDYDQDAPSESDYRSSLARQRELEHSLNSRRQSTPRNRRSRGPGKTIRRKTHCPRVTSTLCGEH